MCVRHTYYGRSGGLHQTYKACIGKTCSWGVFNELFTAAQQSKLFPLRNSAKHLKPSHSLKRVQNIHRYATWFVAANKNADNVVKRIIHRDCPCCTKTSSRALSKLIATPIATTLDAKTPRNLAVFEISKGSRRNRPDGTFTVHTSITLARSDFISRVSHTFTPRTETRWTTKSIQPRGRPPVHQNRKSPLLPWLTSPIWRFTWCDENPP